jgi:hypothetical protein
MLPLEPLCDEEPPFASLPPFDVPAVVPSPPLPLVELPAVETTHVLCAAQSSLLPHEGDPAIPSSSAEFAPTIETQRAIADFRTRYGTSNSGAEDPSVPSGAF